MERTKTPIEIDLSYLFRNCSIYINQVVTNHLKGLKIVHRRGRGFEVKGTGVRNQTSDILIQCTSCDANEINNRASTIWLIITFQFDRDLYRRPSEDTRLDFDKRVFQRSLGGIIMMSHMKIGTFIQIACQRFSL